MQFDNQWRVATDVLGSKVQNRDELFAAYSLVAAIGCDSYLEIGASLGGSVVVLGDVVKSKIVVVDLFEYKSATILKAALYTMSLRKGMETRGISGDSRAESVISEVAKHGPYDVVFIDGGHDYETVKSDWINYGPMARKMVLFHDIAQPGVNQLWEEIGEGLSIYVRGTTMGYGVVFKHDG